MSDQSVVGDLINFRGLVYSPVNEHGVVLLFGKIAQDLNMYVEEIKQGFPDCIGRRFNGKGWERIRIEFEFLSSNFLTHKHDPKGCDLIICWEHNWPKCPVQVMSLKDIIPTLPNPKVSRPDTDTDPKNEQDLEKHIAALDPHVRTCYTLADQTARSLSPDVWRKFNGKNLITYYSPKRVFLYLKFRKHKGVRLQVFTRGELLPGVKQIDFETGGAKWGIITVTSEKQKVTLDHVLKAVFTRINAAIAANENTGWYASLEDAEEEEEVTAEQPAL